VIKPRRALTTLAAGFLFLDAVLFAYAGIATGRLRFLIAAAVCGLAGGLVILAWRRYRRAIADLDRARLEMRAEIDSIRQLLHSHRMNN
jgi:hypothetical protein